MGNIAGNLEYQASLDAALNQEAKLRKSMNAAQLQALNLLLSEVSSLNALENEQIFRPSPNASAGFSARSYFAAAPAAGRHPPR